MNAQSDTGFETGRLEGYETSGLMITINTFFRLGVARLEVWPGRQDYLHGPGLTV